MYTKDNRIVEIKHKESGELFNLKTIAIYSKEYLKQIIQ